MYQRRHGAGSVVMTYVVMTYTVMSYVVMAYIVMAHVVLAYADAGLPRQVAPLVAVRRRLWGGTL